MSASRSALCHFAVGCGEFTKVCFDVCNPRIKQLIPFISKEVADALAPRPRLVWVNMIWWSFWMWFRTRDLLQRGVGEKLRYHYNLWFCFPSFFALCQTKAPTQELVFAIFGLQFVQRDQVPWKQALASKALKFVYKSFAVWSHIASQNM